MKGVITPTITEKNKIVNVARYIKANTPTEYDIEHLKNKGVVGWFTKYNKKKVQDYLDYKNKEFDFYRCWYFGLEGGGVQFILSGMALTITELAKIINRCDQLKLNTYEIDVYYWCLDNYDKIFGDLDERLLRE